jgi:hypothetical protein
MRQSHDNGDFEMEKVEVAVHSENTAISNRNGTDDDYDNIASDFISKDAEWHAYQTKKLLWKVDLRLLPW